MFDCYMSASEIADEELRDIVRHQLARCSAQPGIDGRLSWGATDVGRVISRMIQTCSCEAGAGPSGGPLPYGPSAPKNLPARKAKTWVDTVDRLTWLLSATERTNFGPPQRSLGPSSAQRGMRLAPPPSNQKQTTRTRLIPQVGRRGRRRYVTSTCSTSTIVTPLSARLRNTPTTELASAGRRPAMTSSNSTTAALAGEPVLFVCGSRRGWSLAPLDERPRTRCALPSTFGD